MKKFLALPLLIFTLPLMHAKADTVTNLTIYGNSPQIWNMPYYTGGGHNMPGYAIVALARKESFKTGMNSVIVSNLPDEAEGSSVMVRGLGRNQQVVEQNFMSSNLSRIDIIKNSVGKDVEVEKYTGDGVVTHKGTLLSASDGLVLKNDDKIKIINDYSAVIIPATENTSAGNSINWLINSASSGDSIFEYSYKTGGITWGASYNLYLDGNGTDIMGRLEGWAEIINGTRIDVNNTNIKLVAGEVAAQNNFRSAPMAMMAKSGGAVMDMAESAPAMQQQKFSDYHMYNLERKVSLAPSSSKKVKLFADKEGVIAKRKYIFDAVRGGDDSVKSVVTFRNNEKSRLGIPLPGGKYRLFQKDTAGVFEQVGEAVAEHKAEGEKVELTIGNAFDIKASRKQVDVETDQLRHRGKYTVTVEVESALGEEVELVVKEPVYQQNWQIVDSNFSYKKIEANLVEFIVRLKPKAKTKLEFTVQYSW